MNMRSICLSSCVAIIAASVAFVGAAPQAARTALNVKLGLWEMTTSVQMSGMPAPEPSGKMTPEEKARLDAAMKGAAAAAATPHTTRTCLTREKLDKSLFQDSQQSCKQTMITNTATVNAFKFECTGQPPSTGEFHFAHPGERQGYRHLHDDGLDEDDVQDDDDRQVDWRVVRRREVGAGSYSVFLMAYRSAPRKCSET
jgi:hypothetical protein